jgi:hypothetical protein
LHVPSRKSSRNFSALRSGKQFLKGLKTAKPVTSS